MTSLVIHDTHPAIPGHFPGEPLVPGVVMLSVVFEELARQQPHLRVGGVRKLKFLRRLEPGTPFSVEFDSATTSGLRFKCWHNGLVLADGHLQLI